MCSSCKRSIRRNTTWSAISYLSLKRNIPKFDTSLKLEQLTTKILKQNSNGCKRVELWAKNMTKFREFRTPFPPRDIRKNPRSMYARVHQAMAQFVLKIELLSHIMGTTPILEMARAYGLRPRLWLLFSVNFFLLIY